MKNLDFEHILGLIALVGALLIVAGLFSCSRESNRLNAEVVKAALTNGYERVPYTSGSEAVFHKHFRAAESPK